VTAAIFFIFAALAVVGALGVVLARNPVHSALFLVSTLVSVAVFFIQEDAQLLAVVQIVVYAGAIVVLFLFVIMLLGVDREESLSDPIPFQRPAAIALGVILLAEVLFLAGHQWATGKTADSLHTIKGGASDLGGNVERVARVLFTDFLWPFEITSALLVIAVVGGVVLARRSGQPADPPRADESEADGASGGEPGIPARSERPNGRDASGSEPGIPARSEGASREGSS
jgi:NADH-quinone oxidoreductase subunit J